MKDRRVNVLDEEGTRLHGHEILEGRHEQGHAQTGGDDDLGVDNAGIASHTGGEEILQADQIDVAKHDFALRFPHQQAAVHGAMLLQEGLCSLLELLRTDLFSAHSLGDDERATRDFSEPLGKNLGVDDVAFNDVVVIVLSKRRVHGARVNFL